ncbi:Protein DPY-19 [Aphelenchoides avenae]|nr:Protein DPY-19 [Aphelenchus avenae]
MGKGAKPSRKTQVQPEETASATHSRLWYLFVAVTALALWISHSAYLNTLFENDRHFSHLADFEREMGYRTEMGLYFSYYKTIVTAPTFLDGLRALMYDNVTEYGHTINTLQRFNLYPEVYLALGYRVFKEAEKKFDLKTQVCWRVNRGGDLPPIESCEGIGNMHYFYVYCAFAVAGSVLASVFLTGVILSDSYLGGLLSAVCFVFNHGEATRVQWTPPLRESFGYPVFAAQVFVLTVLLKSKKVCPYLLVALTILTTHFLLFWQFSQFALGTQLASLYVTYALRLVPPATMSSLAKSFLASFAIAFGLLFGNAMLLSSLFSTSLLAIVVALTLRRFIALPSYRVIFSFVLHSVLFVTITLGVKAALTRTMDIHDDDHVFDILRSKFTEFANFHTRLYTCAPEFDFIGMEVAYNSVQLGAFAIVAWMIMRLKLFATPHLCILSSLLASDQGVKNVQSQLNIHGEYSNPEQETLFEWIIANTAEDSVFAGSMPVMANLKLSTGRPIANHPHYEHEEIRNRTLKVYAMYSRKPIEEVHATLRKMGIQYYVFQPFSCQGSHPRPGCTYREMWDLEDPANRARSSLCDILQAGVEKSDASALRPFSLAYNSRSYVIFKI